MDGGGNKWELLRQVKPLMRRMLDDAWRSLQGTDLVVYHPKILAGLDMADALGVPAALAVPAPFVVPTRAFPSAIVPPSWHLGPWFNRLSYAPMRANALALAAHLQGEDGVARAVERLEAIVSEVGLSR